MDDQPASTEPDAPPGTIFTSHRRTQALVLIASVVCVLVFWCGGALVNVPAEPGFQGSLLQQHNWFLAIVATDVLLACSIVLGSLIAGRSWFFAGLFAAVIGLTALSVRGGPSRYVLFDAAAHGAARSVFIRLLVEQVLLFLAIAIVWSFFWRRYEAARPVADSDNKKSAGFMSTLLAVLTQTAILALVVWLLAPTDAKKQVLVGVFIAGFVASSLAEYLFPDPKAAGWYWVGPFLVGAVGYTLAYMNAVPWTIGTASGALANLAHPLPLDYASAGVAGTLLGYWIGGDRPDLAFRLLGGIATGVVVVRHTVAKAESSSTPPPDPLADR